MNRLKILLLGILIVLGLLLGCERWDMDRSGDAWVLVFGEGVVMVYCMVWCGWEVDINCSKEE